MSTDIVPAAPGPLSLPGLPDASILAGQLAARSIIEYRKDIAMYLAWCQGAGVDPSRAASLADWRTHLAQQTTHSPNTINRRIAAVKRLVREAAAHDRMGADAAMQFAGVAGVKVKALRDRQRTHGRTRITPADMRRLCEAPDRSTLRGKRDAALLAVLAGSGLRAHEAAGLLLASIRQASPKADPGKKAPPTYLVSVLGKGQADPRDALLSSEAYQLIREWISARPIVSPFVFTGFTGRGRSPRATAAAMSTTSIWRTVQEHAQACGLEHIKPHDFRRFLGTQIVATTGDIRKAQKALGHKSIETTARHYVLDQVESGLSDGLY